MADDLDANFEIDDEFIPEQRPHELNEDIDGSNSSDETRENSNEKNNVAKRPLDSSSTAKSRRKRKNITEILELKKDELAKASYAINEFKKTLIDYANKKLSSVEKNELNLKEDMSKRLGKMILKRKKTHKLEIDQQFKKKFLKKIK